MVQMPKRTVCARAIMIQSAFTIRCYQLPIIQARMFLALIMARQRCAARHSAAVAHMLLRDCPSRAYSMSNDVSPASRARTHKYLSAPNTGKAFRDSALLIPRCGNIYYRAATVTSRPVGIFTTRRGKSCPNVWSP